MGEVRSKKELGTTTFWRHHHGTHPNVSPNPAFWTKAGHAKGCPGASRRQQTNTGWAPSSAGFLARTLCHKNAGKNNGGKLTGKNEKKLSITLWHKIFHTIAPSFAERSDVQRGSWAAAVPLPWLSPLLLPLLWELPWPHWGQHWQHQPKLQKESVSSRIYWH